MFIIRADGNGKIGMGHVMRCMSVAYSLQELGKNPVFLTACEESKNTIEKNGFRVCLLPTDYTDMESEITYVRDLFPKLRKELGEKAVPMLGENPVTAKKADVILIDSYFLTSKYVMQMRELAMIAQIEDLGISMPVDLLINYNVYGMRFYYKTIPDVSLKVLLGTKYMPLRREFAEDLTYELRPEVKNIMLTTGGADPCFVSKNFLNAFLRCEDVIKKGIRLHVVSGPYNTFADQLKRIYGKNEQVVIHENVTSMKALMQQADIVVSAAGSTVYEACALGVPLLIFHFADNQRMIDEILPVVLPVKSAGDYRKAPIPVSRRAAQLLQEYINDKKLRERLYEEERNLVDGLGARRVANELIDLCKECSKNAKSRN